MRYFASPLACHPLYQTTALLLGLTMYFLFVNLPLTKAPDENYQKVDLYSSVFRNEFSRFSNNNSAKSKNTQEESMKIVEKILRLGRAGTARRGGKYRSMICTVTRNDLHLREYIVRNLLAGFSHIVIYDNNQIEKGIDYDIGDLLAPFISKGAVTHVPWIQNMTGDNLQNDDKNGVSHECIQRFGQMADWVTVMDTDEVFYFQQGNDADKRDKTTVGVLSAFLDDFESRSPTACGIGFSWRMTYGEHRTHRSQGTCCLLCTDNTD